MEPCSKCGNVVVVCERVTNGDGYLTPRPPLRKLAPRAHGEGEDDTAAARHGNPRPSGGTSGTTRQTAWRDRYDGDH